MLARASRHQDAAGLLRPFPPMITARGSAQIGKLARERHEAQHSTAAIKVTSLPLQRHSSHTRHITLAS